MFLFCAGYFFSTYKKILSQWILGYFPDAKGGLSCRFPSPSDPALFFYLIISLTIDHKSFLFCVNLVFIFPLMHLAYGLGSFIAVMRLLVPQNFKKIYFLRKKIKKAGHEIP